LALAPVKLILSEFLPTGNIFKVGSKENDLGNHPDQNSRCDEAHQLFMKRIFPLIRHIVLLNTRYVLKLKKINNDRGGSLFTS
jgi:hypothetical protein